MEKQENKPAEQRQRNLPTSLQNILANTRPIEISEYHDQLTPEKTVQSLNRLRVAFPAITPGFYDIIMECIASERFTDDRLRDAVDHVIKTCIYPQPTVANVIQFNRKFRVYRYNEIIEIVDKTGVSMDNYRPVRLHPDQQKPVWVHVDDGKWLPTFIQNDMDH